MAGQADTVSLFEGAHHAEQKIASLLDHIPVRPLLSLITTLLGPLLLRPFLLFATLPVDLNVHLVVELFDIDPAILVVQFSGNFDDPVHVGVPEFLYGGQDGDEIMVENDFLTVLQDTDAAAVQEEVPLVAVEGQHHVPKFHSLVQSEFLGKQQSQPSKTVILWQYLLLFQPIPQFQVDHLEVLVQDAHATHNALFCLVHILDVHVDEEGHQRGKHEEDFRLCVGSVLLELQVVERRDDFIHAMLRKEYPWTYRTVEFVLPQMQRIRVRTSEFLVGRLRQIRVWSTCFWQKLKAECVRLVSSSISPHKTSSNSSRRLSRSCQSAQ